MSAATPKHLESPSVGLRTARIVLIVGAVLSAAGAAGSVWLVRAAVLLAIVAGISAVVVLIRDRRSRQLAERRERHQIDLLHHRRMADERSRSREVLDTLDQRLATARDDLARSRTEVATLRARVTELESQLVLREIAAREYADGLDEADVHALPRRGISRTTAVEGRNFGNLEVEIPAVRTVS